MSEKLDGVRAYWDGVKLLSKHGKEFEAPFWFVQDLPKVPLDGELWIGRGKFEEINSLVHLKLEIHWKKVNYMVFDLPSSKAPYESRVNILKDIKFPRHVQAVEVFQCSGPDHMETFLSTVLSKGGEGLVMNKPGSPYTIGRNPSALKVKRFDDMEVKVVEVHKSGQLLCVQYVLRAP